MLGSMRRWIAVGVVGGLLCVAWPIHRVIRANEVVLTELVDAVLDAQC